MLDTYMWGRVERISPEAPVPIVALHGKDYRIGGAGNVALNLQSLGAQVSVLSVIGEDDDASTLQSLLSSSGISTAHLLTSSGRITTNKTRIISRNQQMMRLDNETTAELETSDERRLLDAVSRWLSDVQPQVLIFEDYNKGVLTEGVIGVVIDWCRQRGVITAVDPKRKHFFSYKHVDIFKPNLKEVREGLNLLEEELTPAHLSAVHAQLHSQLQHGISFITLSERGVFYAGNGASGAAGGASDVAGGTSDVAGGTSDVAGGTSEVAGGSSGIIPSHIRNIADVSGAGDTVIAVAALVYAATKDVPLMASIANIAGGLVCEEVGTAAIRKDQLLQECKVLL
jgi:rfaE bifunctional protein kinase chain/domain